MPVDGFAIMILTRAAERRRLAPKTTDLVQSGEHIAAAIQYGGKTWHWAATDYVTRTIVYAEQVAK